MPATLPEEPDAFVDELEHRLRAHVLAEMPVDQSGELAACSLGSLLIAYGNWRSRFIRSAPRRALLSAELQASDKLAEHQTVMDEIVSVIQAGGDLTPHLSRRVATAYVPLAERPRSLARRSDLDLLISDWGIHHLHLSTTMCPDGFYARTGDLLFARFTREAAFLIAILGHGAWAEKDLLRILVRNWSDAETGMTAMAGLSLVGAPSTNEEHLEGRKGGVAQLVEIDGTTYLPCGMTTAGTPLEVTGHANETVHAISMLRTSLPSVVAKLEGQLDEQALRLVGEDPWEPAIHNDCWGLRRGQWFAAGGELW